MKSFKTHTSISTLILILFVTICSAQKTIRIGVSSKQKILNPHESQNPERQPSGPAKSLPFIPPERMARIIYIMYMMQNRYKTFSKYTVKSIMVSSLFYLCVNPPYRGYRTGKKFID